MKPKSPQSIHDPREHSCPKATPGLFNERLFVEYTRTAGMYSTVRYSSACPTSSEPIWRSPRGRYPRWWRGVHPQLIRQVHKIKHFIWVPSPRRFRRLRVFLSRGRALLTRSWRYNGSNRTSAWCVCLLISMWAIIRPTCNRKLVGRTRQWFIQNYMITIVYSRYRARHRYQQNKQGEND